MTSPTYQNGALHFNNIHSLAIGDCAGVVVIRLNPDFPLVVTTTVRAGLCLEALSEDGEPIRLETEKGNSVSLLTDTCGDFTHLTIEIETLQERRLKITQISRVPFAGLRTTKMHEKDF